MSIFAQKSSRKKRNVEHLFVSVTNSIIIPGVWMCITFASFVVFFWSNVDRGKCCKINSICNRSMWHIGVLINQLGAVNHLKRNCQYPFINIHFSQSMAVPFLGECRIWFNSTLVCRLRNKNQFSTASSPQQHRQRQYCHRQTVHLVAWKPIYTAYTIHIPPFWT